MAENDFLLWATDVGANVMSQSAYAASTARTGGVVAGTAASNLYNKAQRQSGFMGAVVAQFIVDETGSDMIDDGDLGGKVTLFGSALDVRIDAALSGYATESWVNSAISSALAGYATQSWTNSAISTALTGYATQTWVDSEISSALTPYATKNSPALTGNPTTPTQSVNDNSTKIASTAYADRAATNAAAAILHPVGFILFTTSGGSITSITASSTALSTAFHRISDAAYELAASAVPVGSIGWFVVSAQKEATGQESDIVGCPTAQTFTSSNGYGTVWGFYYNTLAKSATAPAKSLILIY